ncbi:type IV secretion system protein [Verminephrobacter eiseniae]|uniref:TrbL/VirB6 plasmid conjugal transfer protein n=1 Tax=Verminephrobacter eiseniae (strain EF01-2) TaxID=391735 RepID=A1WP66_VEREI|nr:type IV secretion system protein [Verminephrobacter eiseniae]ABM59423.1 hypothetical protein Veis_3708 [Verminephrobacter eiseniae EF01-2]MCW5284947.1 hypothetical protein [Verminephrobacter eiseniae]MCW5302655.1 hypothetical protein [Verminephrobacter eiseniae]MCW8180262.1 hypothetical protein [Verminephrobacter eiseniae]MCW8189016.1 hypothetical protein [Verminephrobacter eiseniae]
MGVGKGKSAVWPLALSMISGGAYAQGQEPGPADSLVFIADIINSILGKNLIQLFVDSAMTIADKLDPLAMGLAAGLALIAMLWALLVAMIDKSSALTAMVEPLIFAVLTALLLANYGMLVNDIVQLGQEVIEVTGKSVGEAFMGFVNVFLRTFSKMFAASVKEAGFTLKFAEVLGEMLITLLFLAIAFVFILLACKELIGVFLIGPVALGIGVALGPLFIATLPLPKTRRWLDQWLNFLINAAMLTALAIIAMVLVQELVIDVADKFQTPNDKATIGKAIAIALVAAGLGKVFSAIPGFADALLPGRTGAGNAMSGKAGEGVANAVKGAGAMAAGAMAAAGAGSVMSRVGGAMGSAMGSAAQAGFDRGSAGGGEAKQAIRQAADLTDGAQK